MSLTQAEILDTLGLSGKSPARAVVDLSKLELDEARCAAIFRQFAGDDATMPANRILSVVVTYLVYDAAAGRPVDVSGCVARANRLADNMPYNFSDAAEAERLAAKANARAERAEKAAQKAANPEPRETVNPDGSITRKRGRPPSGQKSVYDQVKELYIAAADRSKEVMLPLLQSTLGLVPGTAQTYWYKAKKEIGA